MSSAAEVIVIGVAEAPRGRKPTVLFLVLVMFMAGLRGQSTLGSVEGTVVDASKAAVMGAILTLKNLGENSSLKGESGPQGLYQFLNLPPGRYQITVECSGFSIVQSPEIVFGARETRRADFTLEVAPARNSIEVRANVPEVNTESGVIAETRTSELTLRLPVNWRADYPVYAILWSVPGVQIDTQHTPSIGGGLPAQVEYSVDGISTVDNRRFGPVMHGIPSAESLAEFRVTSAGAGAASSQMGDVTLVTKSGTNQLHGSALWYHQNAAFDAKTYGSPGKLTKVFNDFGASLGGPVLLPGIYDGRNRTFFFSDYEGSRRPFSYYEPVNVPTKAMRGGLLDGVPGPQAVDPSTGLPLPGNRIPLTSINPVATRLMDGYYPQPNVDTPPGTFNFQKQQQRWMRTNGYDVRIDQVITARQRAFVRWSNARYSEIYTSGLLPDSTYDFDNKSLIFSHVISPGANSSNELRFGFSRYDITEKFPILGSDAVASLGLVGLDLTNVQGLPGFPAFYFPDGGAMSSIGHGRGPDDESRTAQVTDVFQIVRGAHTWQFGGEFRRTGYRVPLTKYAGADDFGGLQFENGVFTRNHFADFLLGVPMISYYSALGPNTDESSDRFAVFAQDHWRVTRRLTLDLGLRWEVHPPMREAAGNIANFDQSSGSVIIPDETISPSPGFLKTINACTVSTNPTSCTRIFSASQMALPEGLRRTDHGGWGPRIGVAWRPRADGKLVLRGAFGLYTQAMRGMVARGMVGIYSSDVRTVPNGLDAIGKPLIVLPNVLPSPDALGILGSTADFTFGNNPTLRDPHSYQWNFTVERELPWRLTGRASYIGVQSAGMPVLADFNQLAASTVPYSQSRRPFPQWGRLQSAENLGFANYQGLQLEATRRFRDGLFVQAAYTLSKNLGAVAAAGRSPALPTELYAFTLTDRFNVGYDRGEISGTRRHRFSAAGLLPLPFGKGRTVGRNWNTLTDAFLGGWELSTITMLQSGPYQTPTMAASFDRSNTNVGGRGVSARPDRIGDGNLPNPTADKYYDKSAFVHPPAGVGRFGSAGGGILRGPGTIAVAAGLSKTFRLSEAAKLRMEATFINLPNHPNLYSPSVNIDDVNFGKLMFAQWAENSGNRTGQLGVRIDF